jgi:3-oxoacyl-[acyl-carrier-protein] synthase III
MVLRSQIAGTGSFLPERIVTNDDMSKIVDTSDQWIQERTGIQSRRFVGPTDTTSSMGIAAAKNALEAAEMPAEDIDLIVCATTTPDLTFPATATIIQAELGIHSGAAFDVQAVCSGFVYALATADNFVKAGQANNVLVIGSESFSKILDFTDRSTCVLFGDGAGAVVLKATETPGEKSDQGIFSTHIYSDGRYRHNLYVDGGVSTDQRTGYVKMNGQEVFRHAVENMSRAVQTALDTNGFHIDEVNWFVPHQANRRILTAVARRLKLPHERVISTVDHHANTSAASIPLALDESVRAGKIKSGDLLALEAMGGGFTWGSAIVRM